MSGCRVLRSCGRGFAIVVAILAAISCPHASMAAGSPVPGYSGWTYLNSGGSTWYFYNNYSRFTYNTTTGKWSAYDQYGKKWQTLSGNGASSSYIFDGVLHNLCNGWKYVYSNAAQMGSWARSDTGAARFGYSFSTGRWYEYDLYGGATWRLLSSGGLSGYFLGNGTLNNVGNGWKFVYGYAGDTGNWARSDTGAARFAYNYKTGQWFHTSPYSAGAWYRISANHISASFIGVWVWQDLGNGWRYRYDSSLDSAAWDDWKGCGVSYDYRNGAWFDWSQWNQPVLGYEWRQMTNTNTSAAFIVDGAWHPYGGTGATAFCFVALDNGQGYRLWDYFAARPWEYWSYDYLTGTWNAWKGVNNTWTWWETIAGPGAPTFIYHDYVVPQ
jgi:hypothetical protein